MSQDSNSNSGNKKLDPRYGPFPYDKPTPKPKVVEYYNQLNSLERMKLDVVYIQAIIKQWPKYLIPDFIQTQTNIKINLRIVYHLEKLHRKDTRQWFYNMASDSMAYIETYRQAIDELNQYKRELFLMIASNKTSPAIKVQCFRELHALSKTSILLINDLPYIHNLSNQHKMPKGLAHNTGEGNNTDKPKDNTFQPIRKDRELPDISQRRRESGLYLNNSNMSTDAITPSAVNPSHLDAPHIISNANASLVKNILENLKHNKIYHNKDKQVDMIDPNTGQPLINPETGEPFKFVNNPNRIREKNDKLTEEVMTEMRKQLDGDGLEYDKSLVNYSDEDMAKLNEAVKADKLINQLEDEIEKIGGIENIVEGSGKLKDILMRYEESLSFLDNFMTPAQRESIKRVREFTEE